MWFKNLAIYRLKEPFLITAEKLEESLQSRAFRSCGSLQMGSLGWVSPVGRASSTLVHPGGECLMVAARQEEKILPASVVNDFVAEKVDEIEETQGRTVRRKERASIREEVLVSLLPRAFCRSRVTRAYLDAKREHLLIDTSSAKRAEEILTLLHKTLDNFPAAPLLVAKEVSSVMTHWLVKNNFPASLEAEDECELRAPVEGGAVVRCKQQDLQAKEIQAHLAASKQVMRLSLRWRERVSFLLDHELQFRRLHFLALLDQQDATTDQPEDEVERFDADFALMHLELEQMLQEVVDTFGGEDTQFQILQET